MLDFGTVFSEPFELDRHRVRAASWLSRGNANTRFWLGIGFAVVLGAAGRFAYLFHGAPRLVLSDGFAYHADALLLADGFPYQSAWGGEPMDAAHHPPGWVTLLAGVAEAGGRSMRAHQVTALVIGVGVIVIAGLIGRRYVDRRVGVVAAVLAAVYPGFWVLEAQILSEPLGLVVAGLLMLVLADLWERPTLARALLAGAVSGALALVRSEQLALLAIAVAPVLLLNPRVSIYRRLAWTGAATLTALVLLAPWTIYNLGRFEEPVLVSTNVGSTLLAGNCPPTTYAGELMGTYDVRCNQELGMRNPNLDRSQRDIESRTVAFENMRDNVDQLAATVLARYGRTLGVFRPAQTVGFAASWAGSATWPVWAWVTSFWLIAPLAVYGSVLLRRAKTFQWPLVAPLLITLLVITLAYGEPRYHTPADLGIIVLGAVGLDHLTRRRRRPAQ
jgi:4-amino-4-deoxy-L-arabinose transferase-like glycosyltransferase